MLINRTIDDEYGDPYTGLLPIYNSILHRGWTQGATCQGCGINTTGSPTSQAFRRGAKECHRQFHRTGRLRLQHDCQYDPICVDRDCPRLQPVYVNTTLVDGPHTLVMTTAISNVSQTTNFSGHEHARAPTQGTISTPRKPASIVPTQSTIPGTASSSSLSVAPASSQTSSQEGTSRPKPRPVGPILGGVAGILVALLLLILLTYYLYTRGRVMRRNALFESEGTGTAIEEFGQVTTPPTAPRPHSNSPPARGFSWPPFHGIWPFNTVATLHSTVAALREEVAMLRADGMGVQRCPDTPPPCYEPPRKARRALRFWT